MIWGARASIQAGFFATVLAMALAVPIGLVAGYYRGRTHSVIARLTDVLLAFPFLILAVGLAAILGPSLLNATLALGIAAVPGVIRIARGETLKPPARRITSGRRSPTARTTRSSSAATSCPT